MAASTDRRWRILMIDDSADDAELAEIALQQAGLNVDCRRVDREATLRETLRAFAPDLVLCDVNLPGFSAVEAHALVRAQAPDARIAFFTGLVREDLELPPADALLSKDDLPHLPGVIRTLLAA